MNRPVAILSSLAVLSIFSACKPPEAAQKSTTNSTTTTVGTVDDSAGFWVKPCKKFEESEGKGTCTAGNFLMHKQLAGMSYSGNAANDASSNYNQECKVTASDIAAGNGLINCTVEADELELGFNGISFAYNVPSSMCEYFAEAPFYFWNFQPSSLATVMDTKTYSGATSVSYTLNTDGNVVGGTVTAVPVGDAVLSADGKGARCAYDYSTTDPAGPNCCEGEYTRTVTQQVAGSPDVVTTTTEKWGGKVSNCLAGPAVQTQPKNYRGFPMRKIYSVDGTGASSAYIAFSRSVGDALVNNYMTANHYKGSAPLGFGARAAHTPQPYYDFVCLDRDDEILARIRVTVREWNTLAELNKYRSGLNTGNPDIDTTESNGSSTNDWYDWAEVSAGTGYPNDINLMNLGGGALMSKMTPDLY